MPRRAAGCGTLIRIGTRQRRGAAAVARTGERPDAGSRSGAGIPMYSGTKETCAMAMSADAGCFYLRTALAMKARFAMRNRMAGASTRVRTAPGTMGNGEMVTRTDRAPRLTRTVSATTEAGVTANPMDTAKPRSTGTPIEAIGLADAFVMALDGLPSDARCPRAHDGVQVHKADLRGLRGCRCE